MTTNNPVLDEIERRMQEDMERNRSEVEAQPTNVGDITPNQSKFLTDLCNDKLEGDMLTRMLAKIPTLSKRQASEAITKMKERAPLSRPTARHSDDVTVTSSVPNGTYTVVFAQDEPDRRTIRLRGAEWASDLPEGSQVAEFLAGPDNTSDYTGFAFVVKGRARVWKRFRDDTLIVDALHVLLEGGLEAAQAAGMTYALASGRCWRCARTLTVPASIHRGLGPVCAKVIGGELAEGEDEDAEA